MEEIYQGIRGDQDAKDLAAGELAMLLVQAGYPARAMQLLEPISSHRGLVTMAKIATCYAHQDNLASANVFLDQAEQESSRFLLTMPRELAIEMAHASAAVGNEPQAKEWKEKIFDPADLEVAQSLIEAEQLRRGALPMEKLGVKTEPALLQQIALQLGAKKGSQPQMAEWLKKTEGRVDLMYPVDRVEAYLQLAKASAQLGLGEEAARLRQKAGAFSLQISPRTDSGTEGRVLVAEAYLLAGDRGEAEAWIAKARESLPENSYMAQPKTYSRVAEVVWQMGNAKEAEALWTEALQRARTHLHPRARRLGTLAVLESLFESKVALTPDQEKMVLSVKNEEVQAPPMAENRLDGYLQEAGISPLTGLPEEKAKAAKAAVKDGKKAKDKKP